MEQETLASPEEVVGLHVRAGHLTIREPALAPWQLLPEIPLSQDLMSEKTPGVLRNDVSEPYESKMKYLETHFALCRFEGIEPLRRVVAQFRKTPRMKETADMSIYTQVHVQGLHMSKLCAAFRVSFSTERSTIKVYWGQSERLTPGSLVALSPSKDNFKTKCIVAVVTARTLVGGLEPDLEAGEDETYPPRIDIFLSNPEDSFFDPGEGFVMLETAESYFESVRHTMVGLQHAALHPSRFDKYIVNDSNEQVTAKFAQNVAPAAASLSRQLDDSQKEAFDRMTLRELAVIQGPPGCGKTFTSIAAIQSCVSTMALCRDMTSADGKVGASPPVIISAQTNHALDQLLNLCEYQDVGNIVRLGRRSHANSERTMFALRQRSKAARSDRKADRERKNIVAQFEKALKMCFPENGLVAVDSLRAEGLLTAEQNNSLVSGDWQETGPASDDGSDEADTSEAITRWLGTSKERDTTYVYSPPEGQIEVDPEDIDETAQRREAEEEDKDKLFGEFIPIESHWTGSLPGLHSAEASLYHQAEHLLGSCSDLYDIHSPYRGLIYRYLRKRLINKKTSEMQAWLRQYAKVCDNLKVSRLVNDVRIIQHEKIQVIGCTTTGLTKYRGFLQAVRPKILLIEEAAETREANITSALFPSLEQLVLVGDHQQLTGSCIRALVPYNFHISLNERLITNLHVPFSQLRVQRRMIPTIREVVQTFYPRLQDHEIVKSSEHRPPVPGMGGRNMHWFEHDWPESRRPNQPSLLNVNEADMIVNFTKYLVQNGVKPEKVSILSFYKGQVNIILRRLRVSAMLNQLHPDTEWSVSTIDGFQGEENDIILLSIVRSPSHRAGPFSAGFVQDEHRAVVALSRAKCGFYVFGNAQNLLRAGGSSRETWEKVIDVFKRQENIGRRLPVTCVKHSIVTNLAQPKDFRDVEHGGCNEPCDHHCPMGHPCQLRCHVSDHATLQCASFCARLMECGHRCVQRCGQPCSCDKDCTKQRRVMSPAISTPIHLPKLPNGTRSTRGTMRAGRPARGTARGFARAAAAGRGTSQSSPQRRRGGNQSLQEEHDRVLGYLRRSCKSSSDGQPLATSSNIRAPPGQELGHDGACERDRSDAEGMLIRFDSDEEEKEEGEEDLISFD